MRLWFLVPFVCIAADPLYILHDTPAPMQTLARGLRERGFDVRLEEQSAFKRHTEKLQAGAVFMYIHNSFDPDVESLLIRWTERGGRLIVLHHGMASGKMKSEQWPKFMGVRIQPRDHPDHPWKVFRGTFQVVNLRPDHWIANNKVRWPKTTQYTPSDAPSAAQELPSFDLPDTELFHNHLFTDGRRKTVLLGMKGEAEGRTIMQDRAGWLMPAGKGWVVYFQMGHEPRDFEHPSYLQLIVNAVEWRPR